MKSGLLFLAKAVNELMREPYPNELMHYGILGMKWGIRRYQNPDGTLTEAGKKRYGTAENLELGITKRQAAKLAKIDAQREKKKKDAIASGSAKKISQHVDELSNSELKDALNRAKDRQSLDALVVSEGQAKVDSVIGKIGNVTSTASSLADLYNVGAEIYNAITGRDAPIIMKPKNIDEINKVFKYTSEQKESEHRAWLDNILRTNDLAYVKKHASDFTADEIQEAIKRYEKLEALDDRLNPSRGNSNNNSSNGSNKSNSKNNSSNGSNKSSSNNTSNNQTSTPRKKKKK